MIIKLDRFQFLQHFAELFQFEVNLSGCRVSQTSLAYSYSGRICTILYNVLSVVK